MTMPDPNGYNLDGWEGPIVGAGLSGLAGRTEAAIKAMLQARVNNNETLTDFSEKVFEGVDATLGIVLAPLMALVHKLFPHLDLTGVTTTSGLLALVQKVPLIGDLVELILGVEDGDENDLGTFFLNIRNFFQNIDFLSPDFDPLEAAGQFVENVVKPFLDVIAGAILPQWLPLIHVSHIGGGDGPNLLANGSFNDEISMEELDGWDWDGTVDHTGTEGSGSALCTADGTLKELFTEKVPVTKDQKLEASVFTKYAGVVSGAGVNEIQLCLAYFNGDTAVTQVVLDSITDPTASADWTELSGSHTAPAGVDTVSVRLVVAAAVTAGGVHFDDADLHKTGLLPQGLVDGLVQALTDLVNWLESLVDNILSALGLDPIGTIIDKILDLSDEFSDWLLSTENTAADLANLLGKLLTDPASVIGPLAQSMITGLTGALGNLNTAINQIGDVLVGAVVTPINSAISNVIDWFNSLVNFQDTTTANRVNQQNFQIATLANSGGKKETWECRYNVAFVTFPEIMIDLAFALGGVTGAASAGTAHTHVLNTDGLAATQSTLFPVGFSFGGYITASDTTIVDTLAMKLYKETTAAVNNVYLEILREDSLGALQVVGSVEVSAQLTTTTSFVEAPLPAGVIVTAGERYVVRMRNASTVSNRVGVTNLKQLVGGRDLGFETETAGVSNKTSYTTAEATSARGTAVTVPWAMAAAKNLAQTDQSFSDDYNRSALGGLWFLKSDTGSNQLGISGNRASFSGLTDGSQQALYIRPTAGDKQQVEGTFYETSVAVPGPRCGLLMHCNRDLSQIVYLGLNINTAKIYTGPWNSLTERASVSSGLNDVPWQFSYDPADATYRALKNGQDIGLSWADSSSVVQHGPHFRYGGVRISRASFFNAGRIDNWTLKDWS
ncbi:minor tail protein [Mycobacterium phage Nanosmite]|nr:minor tail protein [Mycobacterium phage Nanosmite]